MRISDWSSDVCSSDLIGAVAAQLIKSRIEIARMNGLGAGARRHFRRLGQFALARSDYQKPHPESNLNPAAAKRSAPIVLKDLVNGHAELILDQHHFPARDNPVMNVDFNRLATARVHRRTRTGCQLERSVHFPLPAPEHSL